MSDVDTPQKFAERCQALNGQDQPTARPAIALALPKPALPVYSSAMDALACHEDGTVRSALGGFVQAFVPPAHGTRLREAWARLDAGLVLLIQHVPDAQALADYARRSIATLQCALDVQVDGSGGEHPIEQWASQHVQYGVLLRVPIDDGLSLMGLAAAYLASVNNGQPISQRFAKAVAGTARTSDADVSAEEQRSWQSTHDKHIHTIRRIGLDHSRSESGDFQVDACHSFIWRAKSPGKNVRLGLADSRSLSLEAFKQVASELRDGLSHSDELAVGVAAGWWSGLTWPLAKRLPLLAPDGEWVIWLDAEHGCYHVNLTPVARNAAAAKGNNNYVPATRTYVRQLPAQVAHALAHFRQARPHALTLGELTGTLDVPEERAVGPSTDRVLKTSIARLYNTRAAVSRSLGLCAPLAALALGEFGRGARSRLYYQSVSPQQLDRALAHVAELLDWGPIQPSTAEAVTIGASVVPCAESMAAIASELALRVAAHRPPRRYVWGHLRDFHNAVAMYTAFVVSLAVLGRQRNSTIVIGARWAAETGLGGVHDKQTPTSRGATSVAICRPAQDQIAHWMRHLTCLLERMKRLGIRAPGLTDRINAILAGDSASLVFTVDAMDLPHDCGSNHAYRAVPETLRVKADSARHFWEHYFANEGLDDALACAQARRSVRWLPYWHQTSSISGAKLRMVVGTLQERVLNELGIHAIEGLRK